MDMNKLKADCGSMLANSNIKPASPNGKRLIHAFWCGAVSAANELPPFVMICLMSGRHDDLVTMPNQGEKK